MASRQTTHKSPIPALILAFAGLLVVAFVVYGPSIKGPFIWDDGVMVYDNASVRASNGLISIWAGHDVDYVPLTSTVFWIEWRMFGDNPAGYRVINILLHVCSSFLIWRILRRLKVPGAGIAAAVFCVHPVCVGTVAWIAELKNTLSVFFALLSVFLCLRARPETTAKQPKWNSQLYILSIVAFALALLSKISVVMLPFVFLALVGWRKRSSIVRVTPFFILSLACGLLGVWFQQHRAMVTVQSNEVAPILSRILGGGYALWFYCAKVLLPINLMPIYPHWNIDPKNLLDWLPSILWVVLLLLVWKWARKSFAGRVVLASLLFFTVMAVPVLGVVPISYLLQTQVADHLQYFPMIGLVALIGFVLSEAVRRIESAKGKNRSQGKGTDALNAQLVAGCVILMFAVTSFARARHFQNPESLWRDNVQKNPHASMAWANLADAVSQRQNLEEAIRDYQQSIKLDPGNNNVRESLAQVLNQTGRSAEAEAELRTVLAAQPNSAHLHNNMGALLLARGDFVEAVTHFQLAVKLAPGNEQAHYNLGSAYARLGQYDQAIAQFEDVLRIDPQNVRIRDDLAEVQRLKAAHLSR